MEQTQTDWKRAYEIVSEKYIAEAGELTRRVGELEAELAALKVRDERSCSPDA